MNIFYLDRSVYRPAEMHCDKHVVKMILETAQMLSTAHRVLDGDEYADAMGLYKWHIRTIHLQSGQVHLWINICG